MDNTKKIFYRGYEITVKGHPTRFGTLFTVVNNYGEPYLETPGFETVEEAIAWDKKNIDACIDQ